MEELPHVPPLQSQTKHEPQEIITGQDFHSAQEIVKNNPTRKQEKED